MPISVLSYNVWGIFISKHLDERMKIIGQRLQQYDIVCLQEQFEQRHCDMLFPDRSVFPYIERYVSCEYGSGLTIASKFPIVASMFLPFVSCGRPERINEGDFIANKGIAAVRIAVPAELLEKPATLGGNDEATSPSAAAAASASAAAAESNPPSPASGGRRTTEVVVINTHFVAQYEKYAAIGGFFNETNAASRLTEAYQMADLTCLLHGTASKRTPLILCGDLNAGHDSHELKLLHDFCLQRGVRLQAALDGSNKNNSTFSSANTYVSATTNEALPIQLDHIVYGDLSLVPGSGRVVFDEEVRLNPLAADGSLSGPLIKGHLSDHFGVAATFSHVEPVGEDSPTAIAEAKQETVRIAKFLSSSGDTYNWHFKLMLGTAVLIFAVSAAGWVTKHPFALTLAGAASMFLVFVAVGHRRHESEYLYRVAAALLSK